MNGPHHFAESERHVEQATQAQPGSREEHFHLALAQVHSTLAIAAATALQLVKEYVELDEDAFAWNEVSGTPPRGIEDVHLPASSP